MDDQWRGIGVTNFHRIRLSATMARTTKSRIKKRRDEVRTLVPTRDDDTHDDDTDT